MSKPLTLSIPHSLGVTEARKRLEQGLASLGDQFPGRAVQGIGFDRDTLIAAGIEHAAAFAAVSSGEIGGRAASFFSGAGVDGAAALGSTGLAGAGAGTASGKSSAAIRVAMPVSAECVTGAALAVTLGFSCRAGTRSGLTGAVSVFRHLILGPLPPETSEQSPSAALATRD